jgi:hypothetical protein
LLNTSISHGSRARAAFDVDLNRIHGYSTRDGRLCYNADDWPWPALHEHDLILVESASAVVTGAGTTKQKKAQEYNRRRWAISNSVQIGRLLLYLEQHDLTDRVLVSPADRWTLKYKEELREAMAGCSGQDNHDIRACRCMLYFHSTNPDKWVPIRDYYRDL